MLMSVCLFACGQKEPEPEPDPGVETVEIEHHDRKVSVDVYRPNKSRFPVVIMSHGFNGSKNDFKTEAEFLMDCGIGAITVQFCGSGMSDKSGFPSTSMTLLTEKEDLIAVMGYAKSLKWFNGDLYLFGGSQGGMISAMAGHDRAEDVKGMVLMFPAFNIPHDWTSETGFYPSSRYPTYESIPATIDWGGVKLGRDFIWTLRDIDVFEKMPAFTKPVMLLHGDKDTTVPLSYSERAKDTYPNAELTVYPNAGHGFSRTVMNDVEEKLLDFIH